MSRTRQYHKRQAKAIQRRASRIICKGRITMEEIIFSLKHYWRFRVAVLTSSGL
jgi:hypothetical protein